MARNDEILPRFIVSSLTGGVAGFIVAAIVAAALSPSLNAMAATTVNDFYRRYLNPEADEPRLMQLSKQATIGWGIVQLAVALRRPVDGPVRPGRGPRGAVADRGPVLGAFLVGVLSARVREDAMLAGLGLGMVAVVLAWWSGAVAWTWYAFLGAAITSAGALAFSVPSFLSAAREQPAREERS